MSLSKYCAKPLLILINLLFFVLGIVVLGIGIWISVSKDSFFELISNSTIPKEVKDLDEKVKNEADYYFSMASLVVIGMGAFIMLLSLIGCCGSFKESKCLLITYATVVILITLGQSIGIILSAVYQKEFQTQVGNAFKPSLKSYGTDHHVTLLWNLKMEGLKCCGVHGNNDFQNLDRTINITSICCGKALDTCNSVNLDRNTNTAPPGCVDKLFKDLEGYMKYAIILAAVVIVVQILAIALALGLSNNINNDNEDGSDYDGIAMSGTNYGGGRVDSMFSH